MKKSFSELASGVQRGSQRKWEPAKVSSMGRERVFDRFDWGEDTFVFEKGALKDQGGHQPILLVRKSNLTAGALGWVMTVSSGNHAVAALPLLRGQFWNLGRVPAARQNKVMMERVLCANLVGGVIEVSQRDVQTGLLVAADEWLQGLGFSLEKLVMVERNPETLSWFQRLGQEWRVRPLAWTRQEMEFAIRTSRKRINSSLHYYHSARGVHFLSYTEFHALLKLARTDYEACMRALRELVATFDGQAVPLRMEKFNGHHEIELFGLRRGMALEKDEFVPRLEELMQDVTLGRVSQKEARDRLGGLDTLFRASLERPELADEESADFIETLYMHLTGAVYEGGADSMSLAFDDHRTALPGATYSGGKPSFHPGVDERSRVMLSNLDLVLSQNETIEYVNIYELRTQEDVKLGEGVTREIEVKTNRRPLCMSRISKRLKLSKPGYGSYMLARVHAFKALGVSLGEYRLLMREENRRGAEVNHFQRTRCPGYPLDDIPARQYRAVSGAGEDKDVLYAIGALLGDAAAQNLAMKKFVKEEGSCRFGEGKEIFEFAYKIENTREMPVRVSICSVRGALGWPDVSKNEKNLGAVFEFYLSRYADVLVRFWRKHRDTANFATLADRFFRGFEIKTREMRWGYLANRARFETFDPKVGFNFKEKWDFALWALDCQEKHLDMLRKKLMEKALALKETEAL